MSVATELPSQVKPCSEARKILGPTGNRVRVVTEEPKRKKKKEGGVKKVRSSVTAMPASVLEKNLSVHSSSSSECSVKSRSDKKKREKINEVKAAKVVLEGGEAAAASKMLPTVTVPFKRCDWITQFSGMLLPTNLGQDLVIGLTTGLGKSYSAEPLYTSFHDEEWGVPVHYDRKLFELLVLAQALGELTRPAILANRDTFRKLFEDFDPSSIAKFSENHFLSLRPKGGTLLSEQKLCAVMENANQLLKIQQEFGSFSNYIWRFVNHKPLQNGFRFARQVPAKTPKSELISKDLMRRGFRYMGPTVVYSFMQVSGMVNDHLMMCSRYIECTTQIQDLKLELDETKIAPTKPLEDNNLSHNHSDGVHA